MQGVRSFLSNGSVIKKAILQRVSMVNPLLPPLAFSRSNSDVPARVEKHGIESTKVGDILKVKGKGSVHDSWLWCTTVDTVYHAVQWMTGYNVGAMMVVKPGVNNGRIVGIITERDCFRAIIAHDKSARTIMVGDVISEENNVIAVTYDTKVMQAMQLMIDNGISHIPVVDVNGMVGIVSIDDVVRAMVEKRG